MYIVPTILPELHVLYPFDLLYPLQNGDTPFDLAAKRGYSTWKCLERLLSTPGIHVNIKGDVSLCIECYMNITVIIITFESLLSEW